VDKEESLGHVTEADIDQNLTERGAFQPIMDLQKGHSSPSLRLALSCWGSDYVISTSRLASARSSRTNARICSISAVRIPCVVRAARIRARPSAVLGPVLLPPCIRHLPFGIAGDRHGLTLRVRAPQRGQDCAKDRCMRQLVGCAGFFGDFVCTPSPRLLAAAMFPTTALRVGEIG
jgi:hypothetical protein